MICACVNVLQPKTTRKTVGAKQLSLLLVAIFYKKGTPWGIIVHLSKRGYKELSIRFQLVLGDLGEGLKKQFCSELAAAGSKRINSDCRGLNKSC